MPVKKKNIKKLVEEKVKSIREKLKERNPIRIIKPHKNKSKKINPQNFLKKDYKKIKKIALDMQMLAYNAEKEQMFGNVYAVTHSQVVKRPMAFFVFNMFNPKIIDNFKYFIDDFGPVVMNPEIVPGKHSSIAQPVWEACMSFPGKESITVNRYYKATFKFDYLKFNKDGDKVIGIKQGRMALKGFYAQLFQHEIDHINGINIYKIEK